MSAKAVLIAVAGVAALTATGWFFAANDLAMRKVFASAHEQVRRETFETSKAYRDGTIQEIRAMQFEYIKASPEHKAALASVIRHKLAGFPQDAIPPDLQAFVQEISQ